MREAHLRDFIAVIETGSVRGAARRLRLTQSAVSRNLTALEKSFGVQLLVRSAHGVEPTEYGRAVLRRARAVDSELRKMHEEIRTLSGSQSALVGFGISAAAEALLLAPTVLEVRKQLPDTLLSIVGGPFRTTIAALREGRVDFAIGSVPAALETADLAKERLFSTDLVIVARHGHPAARSTKLSELCGYEWMVGSRISDNEPSLVALFEERQLPPPRYAVQRESSHGLLYLLLGTDMLAVSSVAAIAPFCRHGLAGIIPIDAKIPPVVHYLIKLAGRPLTPAAAIVAAEFRKASRKHRH
jgi:LysR family transcriptional regulator, regulator of abg operon